MQENAAFPFFVICQLIYHGMTAQHLGSLHFARATSQTLVQLMLTMCFGGPVPDSYLSLFKTVF